MDTLNFKAFYEMAHLIPKHNGKLAPFYLDGGYVQAVDMKFETYPNSELKNKLLLSNRVKFFGKMPDQSSFLVFDGNNLDTATEQPESPDYIVLPDDWYHYALFEFIDGSIKEPS
jgi:hypothetical protein